MEVNLTEEFNNGTAIITISRPQVLNALNGQAKSDLISAIERASSNSEVKSLILTGEGDSFSTGQDLGEVQSADLGQILEEEWNPLIDAIYHCPKIVIASINGVCAGAGISLALACDLIVSAPWAKFISGFSKLGLVPDGGLTFAMVRTLGYRRAMEFFLFNEPLYGKELKEEGLINILHVKPMRSSLELSEKINKIPPLATTYIKENSRKAEFVSFDSSLKNEVSAQNNLGKTKDYRERVKAFLAKAKAPKQS